MERAPHDLCVHRKQFIDVINQKKTVKRTKRSHHSLISFFSVARKPHTFQRNSFLIEIVGATREFNEN